MFRKYLSPDVAEAVLSDPAETQLGGRVEEVTVLFADLQGFPPMSHVISPNQVDVLNRYSRLEGSERFWSGAEGI